MRIATPDCVDIGQVVEEHCSSAMDRAHGIPAHTRVLLETAELVRVPRGIHMVGFGSYLSINKARRPELQEERLDTGGREHEEKELSHLDDARLLLHTLYDRRGRRWLAFGLANVFCVCLLRVCNMCPS